MSRINLILLGESGVGKTSLLNRFKNEQFIKYHNTTIPVEFQVKKVYVEDKEVNLFVWDTSGQERFHSVVRSYYRKGEGVLLVYDVTDPISFYKLSNWLCELKATKEDAQILIAGNKNEDPAKKSVTISMVNNFVRNENLEHMEISALTGENVDNAFHHLTKKILMAQGILSDSSIKSTSNDGVSKSARDPGEAEKIIKLNKKQTPASKKKGCC